jgi:hypothetical protein
VQSLLELVSILVGGRHELLGVLPELGEVVQERGYDALRFL